jgi:hypothetical protein
MSVAGSALPGIEAGRVERWLADHVDGLASPGSAEHRARRGPGMADPGPGSQPGYPGRPFLRRRGDHRRGHRKPSASLVSGGGTADLPAGFVLPMYTGEPVYMSNPVQG